MKIFLSVLTLLLIPFNPLLAQDAKLPAHFVLMMMPDPIDYSHIKSADSLIKLPYKIKILKINIGSGYAGLTTSYEMLYKTQNDWFYQHGTQEPVKVNTEMDGINPLDSCHINRHAMYDILYDASYYNCAYLLIADGKILQSISSSVPLKDIPIKELTDEMKVFFILDKVKPK